MKLATHCLLKRCNKHVASVLFYNKVSIGTVAFLIIKYVYCTFDDLFIEIK